MTDSTTAMNRRLIAAFFAALATLLFLTPALNAQADSPRAEASGGIVSVLDAEGTFTVLLGAIESAVLTETLEGGGPFTLFAPPDEAFAALPEGTLDVLTAEQFADILRFHLVEGAVLAAETGTMNEVTSVQGGTLALKADAGTLVVEGATVVQPDLRAANGVIHVIDSVLLPFDSAEDDEMDEGNMEEDEAYEDGFSE